MLTIVGSSLVMLSAAAYALYLWRNEDRRQEWRRVSRATWKRAG